jgi:hypothetical protein
LTAIAGFTGCGKTQYSVILSEAKNLSLFLFQYLNRREILRFAQNDRTSPFFHSLFSKPSSFNHADQMRARQAFTKRRVKSPIADLKDFYAAIALPSK